MNRVRGWALAALSMGVLSVAKVAVVSAQVVVTTVAGNELRYRGDTVWRYRDTTITRVVLRGDTAIRTTFVHGVLKSTLVYVQRGDMAMLVEMRDSTGNVRSGGSDGRLTPSMIMSVEAGMVEQGLRTQEMMSRMPEMPGTDGPVRSEALARFAFSANTNIEQFKDTVRYIRGCAAAPPVDTTIYLLYGTDSLRRLAPSPRTFDRHMVAAVRGDIGTVMLRSRMSQMTAPASPPIPALRKWPCDKRP